ncbi:hypothetical protein LTR37_000766 [Vermiconidia calcicola]|uniref:Uncharacterized protein n=1 Tax=Vermiconidia calcicola TaxID=1690605 RepID=A0ACC3NX23_9PEZI|nr:hypothetical protein LTR37_000766 [Vermiconidia calcicola]
MPPERRSPSCRRGLSDLMELNASPELQIQLDTLDVEETFPQQSEVQNIGMMPISSSPAPPNGSPTVDPALRNRISIPLLPPRSTEPSLFAKEVDILAQTERWRCDPFPVVRGINAMFVLLHTSNSSFNSQQTYGQHLGNF